jgi:hypothetical protein
MRLAHTRQLPDTIHMHNQAQLRDISRAKMKSESSATSHFHNDDIVFRSPGKSHLRNSAQGRLIHFIGTDPSSTDSLRRSW